MSDPFFKYWGRSPAPIRPSYVENNYYMPSTYAHHCCNGGGNRLWNIMAMLGFMNNMSTQYYPQQSFFPYMNFNSQQSFYPYMNLSSQQMYMPEADPFAACRQLYPEYMYSKSGDTYYCRTADKLYSANSIDELIKKIGNISETSNTDSVSEIVDGSGSAPDKTTDGSQQTPEEKTTSDGTSNNGQTVDNKDSTTVDEMTSVEDTPAVDRTPAKSGKTRRGVNVPEGWTRLAPIYTKNYGDRDITLKNAENIVYYTLCYKMDIAVDNKDISRLVQDVIKYNPSCFNEDGTTKMPFQADKFDFPCTAVLKETYGLTSETEQEQITDQNDTKQAVNEDTSYTFKGGVTAHLLGGTVGTILYNNNETVRGYANKLADPVAETSTAVTLGPFYPLYSLYKNFTK